MKLIELLKLLEYHDVTIEDNTNSKNSYLLDVRKNTFEIIREEILNAKVVKIDWNSDYKTIYYEKEGEK